MREEKNKCKKKDKVTKMMIDQLRTPNDTLLAIYIMCSV